MIQRLKLKNKRVFKYNNITRSDKINTLYININFENNEQTKMTPCLVNRINKQIKIKDLCLRIIKKMK